MLVPDASATVSDGPWIMIALASESVIAEGSPPLMNVVPGYTNKLIELTY